MIMIIKRLLKLILFLFHVVVILLNTFRGIELEHLETLKVIEVPHLFYSVDYRLCGDPLVSLMVYF